MGGSWCSVLLPDTGAACCTRDAVVGLLHPTLQGRRVTPSFPCEPWQLRAQRRRSHVLFSKARGRMTDTWQTIKGAQEWRWDLKEAGRSG